MPKVSVIIPIFGVEKYIERCARSLFEQTLDDIEYIFVDDCTNDHSINVLENVILDYPNRRSQVKIIHHEVNLGLPFARKTGIEASTGDYIAHCDSDDWVELNMYERMYEIAAKENLDIVVSDFFNDTGVNSINKSDNVDNDRLEYIKRLLCGKCYPVVWNKLCKRSLYDKKFKYATGNLGEDFVLTLQLIVRSEKIEHLSVPLYHYYYNPSSLTKHQPKNRIMRMMAYMVLNGRITFSVLEDFGLSEALSKEIDYYKLRKKNFLIQQIENDYTFSYWRDTYREINSRILFNPLVPIKQKLVFVITYIRHIL